MNIKAVFFDDNIDNAQNARAIGIEAFFWENPERARRELGVLGVTV